MKDLRLRRLLAMFLAIIMAMAGLVYTVSAADEPMQTAPVTAVVEVYSPWAYEDIFMAQYAYNLGNEGTYANFRETLTADMFKPVFDSLKNAFDIKSDSEIASSLGSMARGDICVTLYNLLGEATGDNTAQLAGYSDDPAIDYCVRNGILKGRADGDYQLESNCTVEEMIVFSVRAYEYTVRKLNLDTKGFCWKVTNPADENAKNTVYLLGSIHLSTDDSSLYPLSQSIENAFAQSENLVVEADILGISDEDNDYILEKEFLTDGTTIKDYISAETYAAYEEICKSFGIPLQLYNYVKPWAASSIIQQLMSLSDSSDLSQIQINALLGIDMHFLSKALRLNKNVVELESIRFQIDLMDSFSPELQEMLLASSVAAFSTPASDENSEEAENIAHEMFLYLLNMVKQGDEKALTEYIGADVVIEDKLLAEYYNKLFVERNKNMTAIIETFLTGDNADGDYFVVVGAGHLVGKTGVVQLLAGKGYKVERIK